MANAVVTKLGGRRRTKEDIEQNRRVNTGEKFLEDVTPEQQKELQAQGQEFIKQREAIALEQGINTNRAGQILSARSEALNTPTSILEAQALQNQQKQQIEQNLINQQQQARAVELAGVLNQIGQQPTPIQPAVNQPLIPKQTPEDFLPSTSTPLVDNIERGQGTQGTIPSGLALPLTTGNLAVGSLAGGLGAIPAGVSAIPTATATGIKLTKGLTAVKLLVGSLGVGSASAIFGKLSGDRKQLVKVSREGIAGSLRNIADAERYINLGGDPTEAIRLYNEAWEDIDKIESDLKTLTGNDLPFFIESNGKDELKKIESLKRSKFVFDRRISNAVLKPNPNAITEQINLETIEQ